jgi:hypothetical protein
MMARFAGWFVLTVDTTRPTMVPMNSTIPMTVMVDLERAIERAMLHSHDGADRQAACERMDRMREELRTRHGELNVAVELVQESRDER